MNNVRRSDEVTSAADVESLPGFRTWLAANRARFKPGSVKHILFMHDDACRYPWSDPCTCVPGPEIKLVDENPESN